MSNKGYLSNIYRKISVFTDFNFQMLQIKQNYKKSNRKIWQNQTMYFLKTP